MSFLSALGHIGDIVTDFIPGVSAAKKGVKLATKIAGAAGDVGSVLGKQQEGKAKGEMTQAQLNQGQDRNAIDLYQAQQQAQNQAAQTDLSRKNFEMGSRGTNAKQALIGALLGGGMQGAKVGPSGASGGLLASLNGNPDALAAMRALASQAGSAQASPLEFAGGQMLKAPTLTAMPKIDNGGFLSTLANIGQLAGAASPYLSHGNGDDGGNGASRPQQQAVDVLGAMPGGAYKPRTVNPLLQSRDMRDLLMGGNG
jgi:hypothetical protein